MSTTRRGFIQAAATFAGGLLVCPTIRLRPSQPKTIDRDAIFAKFCDHDGNKRTTCRYDLTTPFVAAGNVVATDSRALIRTLDDASMDRDGERKLPNVQQVYDMFWREPQRWVPLPRERLIEGNGPCPLCWDRDFEECLQCAGYGEIGHPDNDAGLWRPGGKCPQCHGVGTLTDRSCPVCRGQLFGWWPNTQPIGDKLLCVIQYQRLAMVPDCEISVGPPGNFPVMFRSRSMGVDGMAMYVDREARMRT